MLKDKFVVNDKEHKKFILSSIGKKWRECKSEIFKKYDWEATFEHNLQNPPAGIKSDHWAIFCQHKTSAKQLVMKLL